MTPFCKASLAVWTASVRLLAGPGFATALAWAPSSGQAEPLIEPAVFHSSGGVLDILMIAKPRPVPTISFTPPKSAASIHPIGWVYEVCLRPPSGNQCPPAPTTVSDYGGVRLALERGDALKIRLVNRLPLLEKAKVKHVTEPGQSNLMRNPTNL